MKWPLHIDFPIKKELSFLQGKSQFQDILFLSISLKYLYLPSILSLFIDDLNDDDFVELASVRNGELRTRPTTSQYNILGDELARRTFDANGDFVVRQFTSSFREHLIDGFNRGFFEAFQGGDESKVVMQISPGKAYVKGFDVDISGTTVLDVDKPRDIEKINSSSKKIRYLTEGFWQSLRNWGYMELE